MSERLKKLKNDNRSPRKIEVSDFYQNSKKSNTATVIKEQACPKMTNSRENAPRPFILPPPIDYTKKTTNKVEFNYFR